MERRGVIDAVAHVPHDVPRLPEGEDDPLFLIGLDFSEDIHVNHLFEQRAIAHLEESRPGDDLCLRQAHLSTDATRWLSPVMIFSETPRFFRLPIVSLMLGLGGSKRTRKPRNVIPASSSLLMRDPVSIFL